MDIRAYLSEREQKLKAELAALRARIAPIERELFEIALAQKAVGSVVAEPFQAPLFQTGPDEHVDDEAAELWKEYKRVLAERTANPYFKLTIKELVLKALNEQFHSGASAQELLEFFESAWGRDDIPRTSLSPQLSRLRAERKIDRNGNTWFTREHRSYEKAATDQ
jgi:hypothetical protein